MRRYGYGGASLAVVLTLWWLASSGVVSAPGGSSDPRPTPAPVPPGAQQVRIVRIVDGDTLHVVATGPGTLEVGQDVSVRLLEIDTPESVAPGKVVQCYAEPASHHLERLLPPGSVAWVVPDVELLDRYGRALLYVWNDHGDFVNLDQISNGYARAVLYEPNDTRIDQMRSAERSARAEGLGLWSACPSFGAPAG